MRRPVSTRNVLASVLLSLTMLTACSTQGQHPTPEQQESAGTQAKPEATTSENLETAGAATMVVLVVGAGLAVAALPIVLMVLLL